MWDAVDHDVTDLAVVNQLHQLARGNAEMTSGLGHP
jgi:hypothetical protein